MNWFKDLFAGAVDKVVDSVGTAIDKNFTTDHERLKMQNELEEIRLKAKIEAAELEKELEIRLEEEISERWKADAGSDDRLAKRVRPISLLYLLGFMSTIIIADSTNWFDFDVKPAYVDLIETLLVVTFTAYFGSRGAEKIFRRK